MDSRMLIKTTWELKLGPGFGEAFWADSKCSCAGWSSSGFFCCPIFFSFRAAERGINRDTQLSCHSKGKGGSKVILSSFIKHLIDIKKLENLISVSAYFLGFFGFFFTQDTKIRGRISDSNFISSTLDTWPHFKDSFFQHLNFLFISFEPVTDKPWTWKLNKCCSLNQTSRLRFWNNDHNHRQPDKKNIKWSSPIIAKQYNVNAAKRTCLSVFFSTFKKTSKISAAAVLLKYCNSTF